MQTFIAELKSDFYKYDAMGLIDDLSVYKWVYDALRPFGGTITEPTETTIYTRNGRADLPDNFHNLTIAVRCTPYYFTPTRRLKQEVPHLQIGVIERERHGYRWMSCDECCVEECKEVITEKIFLHGSDIEYHYRDPRPLRLSKYTDKSKCSPDCHNKFVRDAENEISIKGLVLHADFDDAIFMRYRAFPSDEEGLPYIPDTDLGYLEKYVEAYVKTAILEKVAMNSEEQEGASKLQYMLMIKNNLYRQAMGEVKFANFTNEGYEKIKRANKRQSYVMSGGVDFAGSRMNIKLL